MKTLSFIVNGQNLTKKEKFETVSMTVGYLEAKFEFATDDWASTTKTAIFKSGDITKSVVLENDSCMIPDDILKNTGLIYVSVYGEKDDAYRITTSIEMFRQNGTLHEDQSAPGGEDSDESLDEIASQLDEINGEVI